MPDFEPVYSAAEMRAVEEAHPGYPDSMSELMERAGRAVAEEVQRRYPHARAVTVVCGGGSNGGDGKVCALVLGDAGLDVRVVEAPREDDGGADLDLGAPEVIVDALFGTGFAGTPRAAAARLIAAMNEADAPVVAVDIPSGVDASSGAVAGEAVRADVTVSFAGRKVGQLVAPGRFHCGELVVADIGLEPGETAIHRVLASALLEVPHRAADSNKYSAGAVVVVGASPGMTGAICLAAEAALRADAGYVSVVAPASSTAILEVRLLEPVKRAAPEDAAGLLVPGALETVVEAAKRARAVVLGPGIGRSDGVKALVRELLQTLDVPVVVDADALAGLTPEPFRPPVVLTPHSGELARLLGTDSFRVEAQRLEAVRACAERFGCVTLLKGADTLVADAGGHVVVADHGTPALATAGTGDVLSGILGAFLAKGIDPARAAALAATAHGLASQRVPHQAGLVASDLLAQLPGVLADPS
jgi:ADP-dependent NAD(P)H-hydrate dehydratase / NAD(P)H-hydrate epimerase